MYKSLKRVCNRDSSLYLKRERVSSSDGERRSCRGLMIKRGKVVQVLKSINNFDIFFYSVFNQESAHLLLLSGDVVTWEVLVIRVTEYFTLWKALGELHLITYTSLASLHWLPTYLKEVFQVSLLLNPSMLLSCGCRSQTREQPAVVKLERLILSLKTHLLSHTLILKNFMNRTEFDSIRDPTQPWTTKATETNLS